MPKSTVSCQQCGLAFELRPYELHARKFCSRKCTGLSQRTTRSCSVPGCEKATRHGERGWCPKHYDRWREHGDPLTLLPRRPAAYACSIEGCEKGEPGRISRGWCHTHYMRWRQHGDPLFAPSHAVQCSVRDCERSPKARGWCLMHYGRWKRYGDPLSPLKRRYGTHAETLMAWRHRNRALRAGGETEPYDLLAVYERDGWTCQLCRKPVDPQAEGLWGKSRDHIAPITRGGSDTPQNVWLAHRKCNCRKNTMSLDAYHRRYSTKAVAKASLGAAAALAQGSLPI